MPAFSLHPQLAADTSPLAALPLCDALLMNNALFPWVILVPRVAGASQITDLDTAQQHALMDEIAHTSRALQGLFQPVRINVGALGNMVPQLHVHVIARFETDAAWPKPVWGMGHEAYAPEALESRIAQLRTALLVTP